MSLLRRATQCIASKMSLLRRAPSRLGCSMLPRASVPIHYPLARELLRGTSPPFWHDAVTVLLPGILLTQEMFEAANLSNALGLPGWGHGLSEQVVAQSTSVASAARAIVNGLDSTKPGSRALLVGHSYGGYIAMEVARLFPERVAGMVLISTQARADTDGAKRRRQDMAKFARKVGVDGLSKKICPSVLPGWKQNDTATLGALRRMAHEVGVDGFVRQMEACQRREDQREALLALPAHIPVLALGGNHDLIIPPRALAEQREILKRREKAHGMRTAPWSARGLAHCGHLIPMEQPEILHTLVGDWAKAARSHAQAPCRHVL